MGSQGKLYNKFSKAAEYITCVFLIKTTFNTAPAAEAWKPTEEKRAWPHLLREAWLDTPQYAI